MQSIDETNLPRYAMFRGRKVQLVGYTAGAFAPFHIIDTDDTQRTVARQQLTFIKEKKNDR